MSVNSMLNYLQYQPLDIAINTPSCVLSYKTGVITPSSCSCLGDVNHAVNIVGYSINTATPGCYGYWIIKNSSGAGWGESGYFKLCIPTNTAGRIAGTCNTQFIVTFPNVGLVPGL